MRFIIVAAACAAFISAPALSQTSPFLTPDGYGRLKIGMTEAEARKAMPFKDASAGQNEDWNACHELSSKTVSGMHVMIQSGKLTRIAVHENTSVTTDRGIGVGAPESAARQAYFPARRETAPYVGEPSHELYFQPDGRDANGLRITIDEMGVVSEIYAGTRSIESMEGCL